MERWKNKIYSRILCFREDIYCRLSLYSYMICMFTGLPSEVEVHVNITMIIFEGIGGDNE